MGYILYIVYCIYRYITSHWHCFMHSIVLKHIHVARPHIFTLYQWILVGWFGNGFSLNVSRVLTNSELNKWPMLISLIRRHSLHHTIYKCFSLMDGHYCYYTFTIYELPYHHHYTFEAFWHHIIYIESISVGQRIFWPAWNDRPAKERQKNMRVPHTNFSYSPKRKIDRFL